MSYVPTHLAFSNRQFDGWPMGLSEADKVWARDQALKLFAEHKRPLDPETLRRALFQSEGRPQAFKTPSLYDYQYATADRAMRAAGARQLWVLGEV